MRLILASGSPRRAELLTAAGFTFEVCVPDVDESVEPGEPSSAYVQRLAAAKSARALEMVLNPAEAGSHDAGSHEGGSHTVVVAPGFSRASGHPEDILVIGADTAVVVDGEILGKPVDADESARMIRRLSGRTHLVQTGVSIRTLAVHRLAVSETCVTMAALTGEQVDWYVGSGEGRDKAGAYAIQGLASRFVTDIDGSYSNVVGLPVALVDRVLREVHDASGALHRGGSRAILKASRSRKSL